MVIFGLIILSSAGIIDAQRKFGSAYYYFNHQLLYGILPGLLLAFFLSGVNYNIWRKLALPILFFALLLMVLVFIPEFGFGLKGATRWVSIKGVIFQPAEILKLSLIIYLAAWFGGRSERIKNWSYGTAPFLIVLSFIFILLALQPDVGTLIVVGFIALGMYFVAGVNLKHLFSIVILGMVILGFLIVVEPYRLNRLKTYFDISSDPRGISYQVNQSLISIGSGGIFGVGFGHSTQKFGFLPEVIGDSIFAVAAEELGLVGSGVLVILFVTLSTILVKIAKNAPDKFSTLFVMGINIWIISQAFINIAAISGLVPLTGIPLPFVSYGGTAMITLLAGLGIVLNITKKV